LVRLSELAILVGVAVVTAGCSVAPPDGSPRAIQCYTDTYCQLSAGEDFCSSWVDPRFYFCSHTCDSSDDCAAPFSCRRFVVDGLPVEICFPDGWDGTEM
jgi:hypothetical protein